MRSLLAVAFGEIHVGATRVIGNHGLTGRAARLNPVRAIFLIKCLIILACLPAEAAPDPFKNLHYSGKQWLDLIDKSNKLSDDNRLSIDEKRRIFCRYGLQALRWGEVYKNELFEAAEIFRLLEEPAGTGYQPNYNGLLNDAKAHTRLLTVYYKVYQNCRSYGYDEISY